MYTYYKDLLKDGINPKTKPYPGVIKEDWAHLIDVSWVNEKFLKRSEQNKEARAEVPYNHTCGSRSFMAAMSIEAENKRQNINKDNEEEGDEEEGDEEEGQRPHIADFYRTSHWSKRKNDWIDPKCKENYDKLQNLKKRSMQPGATPMSKEVMSVLVLGKKSGYLRGYGVGPKPARGKGQSQARDEEVRILREKLASLEGLNASQQERIEAQDKKFEDFQAYMMQTLAEIRRGQDYATRSDSNYYGTNGYI